jgi:hypothetical protein
MKLRPVQTAMQCQKCGAHSGDDWRQCEGNCPIKMSPHYLGVRTGWLFRPGSLWIGAHWSKANRRWCINFVPCVTFWIVLPGGNVPCDIS